MSENGIKFDEAAFDAAVSKPNGWSKVADPVAEIRRMRGDPPPTSPATPEPLAAIVAEMRKAVVPMLCGRPKIEAVSIRDVLQWADRIEEAYKREREIARDLGRIDRESDNMARAADALEKAFAPGSAAAMREALTAFVGYLTQKRIDEVWAKTTLPEPGLDRLVAQARAALAAPPEPPSNAAAMREALDECYNYFYDLLQGEYLKAQEAQQTGYPSMEQFSNENRLLSNARAALAAPARNCDRFATAEEAYSAWESDNKKPPEQCFLQWLFATAEGGDHA